MWEQPLADRLRGAPLTLEARMEPQSILYSTLLLFGATLLAVVALFAVVAIWWVGTPTREDRKWRDGQERSRKQKAGELSALPPLQPVPPILPLART